MSRTVGKIVSFLSQPWPHLCCIRWVGSFQKLRKYRKSITGKRPSEDRWFDGSGFSSAYVTSRNNVRIINYNVSKSRRRNENSRSASLLNVVYSCILLFKPPQIAQNKSNNKNEECKMMQSRSRRTVAEDVLIDRHFCNKKRIVIKFVKRKKLDLKLFRDVFD